MFITAQFIIAKKVETTQMSTDEGIHRATVVYLYDRTLCCTQKEENTVT